MAGPQPSDHPFSPSSRSLTDTLFLTRGSRYIAYAHLRESKLRLKSPTNPIQLPPKNPYPPNNNNKNKNNNNNNNNNIISVSPVNNVKIPANKRKVFSVLTQSVPDFSPMLRKENRRPALPPVVEKSATPPAKSSSRLYEVNSRLTGSKSMVSREKKSGGMAAARRSCVNMDELKKFSMAAANAIDGENRGGKGAGNRGGGRSTVLGTRQYY